MKSSGALIASHCFIHNPQKLLIFKYNALIILLEGFFCFIFQFTYWFLNSSCITCQLSNKFWLLMMTIAYNFLCIFFFIRILHFTIHKSHLLLSAMFSFRCPVYHLSIFIPRLQIMPPKAFIFTLTIYIISEISPQYYITFEISQTLNLSPHVASAVFNNLKIQKLLVGLLNKSLIWTWIQNRRRIP